MTFFAIFSCLEGDESDLLKVKKFIDDEAIIVGHEQGKGRHAGRMEQSVHHDGFRQAIQNWDRLCRRPTKSE